MHKQYGITWWGEQWLNALKNIDYANRIPRGKTYANKGAVKDLNIYEGNIYAKVKGSMPKPYQVTLQVQPFTDIQRRKVLHLVEANLLLLSQLLARTLPVELNDACLGEGIRIFPGAWKDVKGSCSCPDGAVPCKHIAAVLFLIGREIDQNPFLVLELHGLYLVRELEAKGYQIQHMVKVHVPEASTLLTSVRESELEFQTDSQNNQPLDGKT